MARFFVTGTKKNELALRDMLNIEVEELYIWANGVASGDVDIWMAGFSSNDDMYIESKFGCPQFEDRIEVITSYGFTEEDIMEELNEK